METGRFVLQDNLFIAGGKKFVIRKRKAPTGKKPELYLIQVEPFRYISSLYPNDEKCSYTFDFQKQMYLLHKESSGVEIAECE